MFTSIAAPLIRNFFRGIRYILGSSIYVFPLVYHFRGLRIRFFLPRILLCWKQKNRVRTLIPDEKKNCYIRWKMYPIRQAKNLRIGFRSSPLLFLLFCFPKTFYFFYNLIFPSSYPLLPPTSQISCIIYTPAPFLNSIVFHHWEL